MSDECRRPSSSPSLHTDVPLTISVTDAAVSVDTRVNSAVIVTDVENGDSVPYLTRYIQCYFYTHAVYNHVIFKLSSAVLDSINVHGYIVIKLD